ncbi:dUTP diphosphatase [Mycobacteroides abscessus]|uniref:dUTP diphosphatase n=1 Tax=Mycobacteroides abscessus TaxID=36809 RepID=UPI000C25C82F|nr:dUTP diphosphatase [Mycobacteroides abscessus]
MQVKIQLEEGAIMPKRSTPGAAGWDVFAWIDQPITLNPGEKVNIPTGIRVELPRGTYWDGRVRSGLSTKHGIMLTNGAGVIDEDYRGIVGVPLIHMGKEPYTICPGEKIAQMILKRYEVQDLEWVETLTDTDRGEGGFGHTGKS